MSYPPDSAIATFIQAMTALPTRVGVSLDAILLPCLHAEARIRRHFSEGKLYTRLRNPYIHLIDVYDAGPAIRTTRARLVTSRRDRYSKYILPLPENVRRENGAPSLVEELNQVLKNINAFTDGILGALYRTLGGWANIALGGGAVLACVLPLPAHVKSPEAICNYYKTTYPESDIDIFLYGLTEDEAEAKILEIYECICNEVPGKVEFKRTKYTISIYRPPYRTVQIILRLYRSPAEILCGFDIDAACFLFDGYRVYSNPRGLVATMRQANTINIEFYSPEYGPRHVKYVIRGFEIYFPDLDRQRFDSLPCAILGQDQQGLAFFAYFEWRFESENTGEGRRRCIEFYLQEKKKQYRAYQRALKRHTSNFGALEYHSVVKLRTTKRKENSLLSDCISFWDVPRWNAPFRPSTIEEWCAPAYLTTTELFFKALKARNRDLVQVYLRSDDFDPNERDVSGKTALRLAIELGEEEIACEILEAGAFPDFGMPSLLIKLVQTVEGLFDDESDSDIHFHSFSAGSTDESEIQFVETAVDEPEPLPSGIATGYVYGAEVRMHKRAYNVPRSADASQLVLVEASVVEYSR